MADSMRTRQADKPSVAQRPWWKDGGIALLLIAATVAVYWPAMHGGFLWDDDDHISANQTLRSLSGLWQIWFKPLATCQYYPLSFTVFWADYQLWGLNTVGYHLQNALLHGMVAVLLWQVLQRLRVPGACLAGAIFALHPVCVMSVAWMTELKNTLSAVLALGAIWAYVKFVQVGVYSIAGRPAGTPQWRYYVLSLVLFQMALFAKTAVSFVPVTLFLVVWWQRNRILWRDVWPLIPMLLLAVLIGKFTFTMERQTGAGSKEFSLGLLDRILLSGRSFWFYLSKLVFPVRLGFFYERWTVDSRNWWSYAYPAATLGLLAGLWGMRRRIGKAPFVAMLHYYVTTSLLILLVVLFMTRYTWVADHWQYFGCMSVVALAAAGMVKALAACQELRPWLGPVLCGALLTVLGALTWRQSGMYTDRETLWRTTIANNPNCWMPHYSLGITFLGRGQLDQAIEHFQKSFEILPGNAFAHDAHNSLGVALAQKGRLGEAMAQFRMALNIDPGDAGAMNNLAGLLMLQGQVDEVIGLYIRFLDLAPNDPDVRGKLGDALLQRGRLDEAIVQYRRALESAPGSAQLHGGLGNALLLEKQVSEAIIHYQTALASAPTNAFVLGNLAWVLATCPEESLRNGTQAVRWAERADQVIGGTNLRIIMTLAAAYAEAGRFPEAMATARRGLDLAESQATAPETHSLDDSLRAQLALYQAGSPYRDPSLAPASH